MKTMSELQTLWQDFGNVPTDDDLIIEDWEHFPAGTDRFEIWHWFEEQNPKFYIAKILYP